MCFALKYACMSLGYWHFGNRSWCIGLLFISLSGLLFFFNTAESVHKKKKMISFHGAWQLFVFSLVASLLCLRLHCMLPMK